MQEKEKSTPYSRQGLGSVPWLALLILTMVAPSLLNGAAAPDWVFGDVFVAIGGGQYQVWHSDDPTNPSQKPYQNVQTISDGLGGTTAGCAFDSAYRLFGTNSTSGKVDQYSIDFAHGLGRQFGSGAAAPQSIAFDGAGSFFVGHATTPTIEKGSVASGTLSAPFNVPVDVRGAGWIDLASDGNTIYYTSAGRKILTYDASSNTGAIFANLAKYTGTLNAIRVLPGGGPSASNGVLVADQVNVKLVKASRGKITSVTIFNFTGESNLQALSLDPNNPSRFWVGDANTKHLIQFDMTTGTTVVTLNTGTAPGGICVDGSFSAAQPQPDTLTPSGGLLVTPASNTITLTAGTTGTVFKATLAGLANDVTVTLRHTLVNPLAAQSDATVFSLNPGTDRITTPIPVIGNMVCDTALPDSGDGTQGKCEVFEFEVNPTVDLTTVTENIQICPSGSTCTGNPTDFVGTASNPRLLRNLDEDITSGINTYPLSGGRNCVFTVHQQGFDINHNAHSCGFQSPIQGQNFTKIAGSSIPFKFTAITGTNCQHGPFLSGNSLEPLLLITRLVPPAAPTAQTVIVKGNSGGPPLFIFSGQTWQLQVDTSNLPVGNYLATVIDLNNVIPAFGVSFSLN